MGVAGTEAWTLCGVSEVERRPGEGGSGNLRVAVLCLLWERLRAGSRTRWEKRGDQG